MTERNVVFDAKDRIEFNSIYDAINAAIGTNYTGWMKATWPGVMGNGKFRMWFPKLAKTRNGQYVEAANKCLNILSDDWNELIFDDLDKRDKPDKEYYSNYDLIFAKEENEGYVFRGVFVRDGEKSSPNHRVSKRIATKVRMVGNPAYDIELLDSIDINPLTINDPIPPQNIIEKENGLYFVCGRCGEMFRESRRCSECGQLVLIKAETDIKLYFNPDDSSENIVNELIRYMEAKGLVFSSKIINGSTSYGILNGKTSVGYRYEGIVLFCAKDGIDKNAIVAKMKLPVFNNTELTRPYKIVLDEQEFIQAVDILLENENNR